MQVQIIKVQIDLSPNSTYFELLWICCTMSLPQVQTSNLRKAHVTRDSSDPAIWQSVYSMQ